MGINLPRDAKIRVKVFDLLGREVATVAESHMGAGAHTFTWHADGHAAGVYFLQVQAGPAEAMRKIVLLK